MYMIRELLRGAFPRGHSELRLILNCSLSVVSCQSIGRCSQNGALGRFHAGNGRPSTEGRRPRKGVFAKRSHLGKSHNRPQQSELNGK
jgi:hypothetical protein